MKGTDALKEVRRATAPVASNTLSVNVFTAPGKTMVGERVQDIQPLTKFFVAKFAASLNKPIDSIPDEVIEVLKAHDWPGNIRELQNFIERAVLYSPGSVLRLPLDPK